MKRSDIFMHCGHLQFQQGSWHNRNYIKFGHIVAGGKYSAEGKRHRLSIPIQRPHIRPIRDVKFNDQEWKKKHLKTILQAYGPAPFFKDYFPALIEIICSHPHSLERLNIELTDQIARWLGIRTHIIDSANWHFNGDAVDMIIQMCQAVGADRYLSNPGAAAYIDLEEEARTEAAGIKHGWLDWKDPDDPEPLSAIHHLFMLGPEAGRLIQ